MSENQINVLVVDVGGSSVKLWHTRHEEHRKFESGRELTPEEMVKETKQLVADWSYDGVALGIPCRVSQGRAVAEPPNLGPGWMGYNYASAFERPARIMNDACLQALGSFDGGRMLFLGFGTGIGSALVSEGLVLALDLGQVDVDGEPLTHRLCKEGQEAMGIKKWNKTIQRVVPSLQVALMADYVVLGGGLTKDIDELPHSVRRGHNRAVVDGGRRLWADLPDPADAQATTWIVR